MSLFSGTKKPAPLNCQEAYNIWDILSAKYQFVEKLHLWHSFVHDKDLDFELNKINVKQKRIIKILEEKAKEYFINGPEVGVKAFRAGVNTEVVRDEMIAQDVLVWLQGVLELLLRALRTTTTSDDLRKLFMKITNENLDLMDNLINYLRLKGWINVPLRYPNIPQDTKEDLDAGEAFHLWDHLTFRYDNIHQTEMFIDYVKDSDLKLLITMGLQAILKKQVKKIEQELLYFGIPLPKKPAEIVSCVSGQSNSCLTDDYIYRIIVIGIIGASNIHVAAVKQSLTNDRIRKFFIQLLRSEIEIFDNFISYGKLKGYLHEPPQYNSLIIN